MNLNYLRSYSVESQLSFWGRGHEAISWSVDNQVALVHKKGVNIYECSQNPAVQKRPPLLTIFPSRIDISPKTHVPDTGDVLAADIMKLENKQHVFDLMRDHILRPHGYDTMIFHNYITKASWSPIPVFRGLHVESRCILGVLSATHQFLIYGRRHRRFTSELWTEPWEVVLDITALYNEYLCQLWTSDEDHDEEEKTHFDTYKRRLYQIAITNFLWLPDWSLNPDYKHTDNAKSTFQQYLMTFHATGDVCIWKIVVSKTVVPKYSATVVFRKTTLIEKDDIVSSAIYFYVSSECGLLLLGTNKGKLMSYKVEKQKTHHQQPLEIVISNEQCLWKEDMIRVENILLQPISDGKRKKLDIIAVKNPNILIANSINITQAAVRMESQQFSVLRVPFGAVVGISMLSEGEFVVAHEPGQISMVSFKNGKLVCMENSLTSIFDPHKSSKKKAILLGEAVQKLEKKERKGKIVKDSDKRLIFQGLALSPNKMLLCTARTVGLYYDHLQIRKPTQLVFYSLLPPEDTFSTVRQLYAENNLSLRAIADVLVPFRNVLRRKNSSTLYKEIFDWAVPLEEKTTPELRLLLWCLRICPKSDPNEWEVAKAEKQFNPLSMKKLFAVDALHQYRIDLITDKIMTRRCESLVRAVLNNPERKAFSLETQLNKQSLHAMYEFLESKGEQVVLPEKPVFDSLPYLPTCYWCKGPLVFPEEYVKYEEQFEDLDNTLKTDLDRERIQGFKWKTRRHPVKEFGIHKPEICILSLVPLQFPYRRCTNCLVPCLMEPAFGQLPYCPLCNSMMYPNQLVLDIPDATDEIDLTTGQHHLNRDQTGQTSSGAVNIKRESESALQEDSLFGDQESQDEMKSWLEQIKDLSMEGQQSATAEEIEEIADSSSDDE